MREEVQLLAAVCALLLAGSFFTADASPSQGRPELTLKELAADYEDCAEIQTTFPSAPSGVYSIFVQGLQRDVDVYCDMDTAGGGWTVFQRRMDGSVLFYNDWQTYVVGFGRLDGEFWLGNDNLAALTATKQYVLRVDLGDWANERRWAEYNYFRVLGAVDKYRLSFLGTYSGNAVKESAQPSKARGERLTPPFLPADTTVVYYMNTEQLLMARHTLLSEHMLDVLRRDERGSKSRNMRTHTMSWPGDSLSYHLGWAFSTHDQGNDRYGDCAEVFRGAWWFNNCHFSHLNGEYNITQDGQGVIWTHWTGDDSLKFTEMKIRPANLI